MHSPFPSQGPTRIVQLPSAMNYMGIPLVFSTRACLLQKITLWAGSKFEKCSMCPCRVDDDGLWWSQILIQFHEKVTGVTENHPRDTPWACKSNRHQRHWHASPSHYSVVMSQNLWVRQGVLDHYYCYHVLQYGPLHGQAVGGLSGSPTIHTPPSWNILCLRIRSKSLSAYKDINTIYLSWASSWHHGLGQFIE